MSVRTVTYISSSINDRSHSPLVVVAVARQRRADRMEIGCFLVDPACLGVKDAWLEVLHPSEMDDFQSRVFGSGYLEKSGAWGRKFVEGAVDYANRLGFKPHADYKKAARVFGGIRADDCAETFEYGSGGKPFYIQGPYDSQEKAERIIRQLRHRCGEDGFEYMAMVDEDDFETEIDDLLQMAENEDFPTAEAEIYRLLEAYPESSLTQYAAGMLCALKENLEEALDYLDTALELDPGMGIAWYNKGVTHKKLLQFTPMLVSLRKAVSLSTEDSEYVESANELISIMERSAKEEFGLDLDAFIESGIRFDKAWEAIEEQDWETGRRGMGEVIEINPLSYQAYGNMGLCLLQLNRISEARKAFQKALEIKPDYEPAMTNLQYLETVGDAAGPVSVDAIRTMNTRKDSLGSK